MDTAQAVETAGSVGAPHGHEKTPLDSPREKGTLVLHRLRGHFRPVELEDLQVLRRNFPVWMRRDVQAALFAHFNERSDHQFVGCRLPPGNFEFCFQHLLEEGEGAAKVGPTVFSPGDHLDESDWLAPSGTTGKRGRTTAQPSLHRGLWLDHTEGVPYGVLLERNMRRWDTELRVEIAVPNDPIAIRFAVELLDTLTQAGRRAESLRGQVLQIVLSAERGPLDEGSIDFAPLELRQIDREHIILDDQTFELFERNTIGFMSHRDALQQLGFSAKKGVLLYGPPGTGKTLLANYLLSNLEGFTRLVLSANTIHYLSEAMALVREVGSSVVVIEDIDLVAETRENMAAGRAGLLNVLLNEMDGLASDSTVLFLLTTNRPEVLEPALAARPGRVDQAIEIDLPDHRERCRLLEHYSRNLAIAPEMVVATSRRVGKVSAAFVKELVRRAAQVMLEEGGARLEESFLLKAHEDMVRRGKKVGFSLVGGSRN